MRPRESTRARHPIRARPDARAAAYRRHIEKSIRADNSRWANVGAWPTASKANQQLIRSGSAGSASRACSSSPRRSPPPSPTSCCRPPRRRPPHPAASLQRSIMPGAAAQFVARMNAIARSLGMTRTRYTDPSGYDDRTASTAADQLRVVDEAMRLPAFANIVASSSATLPVAGTVHNTNTLLGRNGFVGVKTGSDKASGGCFAFRAIRLVRGRRTTISGVVLGQPGNDLIDAGLVTAESMVDAIV